MPNELKHEVQFWSNFVHIFPSKTEIPLLVPTQILLLELISMSVMLFEIRPSLSWQETHLVIVTK
jgi:hypothetical protein